MWSQQLVTWLAMVQAVHQGQVDYWQWQLAVSLPLRSAQRYPPTLKLIGQEHTLLRAPQRNGTPRPQGRIRAPETETPLPQSWLVQRALMQTWRMSALICR